MNENQYYHSNNIDIKTNKISRCAGLNCLNEPVADLNIKCLNKTGLFCQSCIDYLLQADLASDPKYFVEKRDRF